jgi:Winged helix DNA-binding domain
MMAEDVDALARTRPSREVRLVAGFDQYLLGPGTGDARIVAPDRRKAVSRTAGWISPVVVHEGRVVGVWELADGTVDVRLFPEAPGAVTDGLKAEVEHLAACTGRALSLTVGVG